MVAPKISLSNRSTEMEIKTLKLSSKAQASIRAPTVWEKPTASNYDYHYEIGGIYYQVRYPVSPCRLVVTVSLHSRCCAIAWTGSEASRATLSTSLTESSRTTTNDPSEDLPKLVFKSHI